VDEAISSAPPTSFCTGRAQFSCFRHSIRVWGCLSHRNVIFVRPRVGAAATAVSETFTRPPLSELTTERPRRQPLELTDAPWDWHSICVTRCDVPVVSGWMRSTLPRDKQKSSGTPKAHLKLSPRGNASGAVETFRT